ncbi:MAG TPA: deiodinase family protein [Gemmataceae bacterium]|nr:deiodinase family protein [Gemmataceae bacterium]
MTNIKALIIGVLGLMLFLAAADAQEQRRKASPPDVPTRSVGTRKEDAAALLESAYEGELPPEAVRMLAAVLRGSRMGPGDGWFGPAEIRYSWKWLAQRCGVDPAKGGIPRERFRGSDAWFARLDRNKDGAITADDFDWSERSPYMQMSRLVNGLFGKLNAGRDGRLTKDELLQFFNKAAKGKDHLSADDFRDALLGGSAARPRPTDMPSQAVLIRGLFAGELGSLHEGPKLDQPAPDFTLKTSDGKETIQLAKRIGPKPVVLVFGSFT